MIGFVWRALGVDPDARRVLHKAFWDLSRRGGSALIARRSDAKPPSLVAVYGTYAVIGLLSSLGAAMGIGATADAFATQLCTTALVLLSLAIVGDFAAVVIAPGDDEILFPLPISSRTYLAARLSVAAAHTTRMAIAFASAPVLVGGFVFHDAPYAVVLLGAVVATGLFALLLSFVLYRVALALLGGDRLRTALAYLPAFVSLAVVIGPQLLARSTVPSRFPPTATIGPAVIASTTELGAWAVTLPSAWFSAFAALAGGVPPSPTILLRAGLGLVALPLGALLLVRALGGTFLAQLIQLVGAKDAGPSGVSGVRALPPGRLVRRVLGLRSDEACAGYLLALGASRSRETRARSFAFVLMPIAFTLLGFFRDDSSVLGGPLFGLFFLGASAGTVVSMLPYHEHREAGWIHEALPFRRYGEYLLGVVKATISRQVLPWLALIFALAIVKDPTPIGAGLAFHIATGSLLAVPIAIARENDPPFSRAFTGGETGGRMAAYFLSLGALLVVGGIGVALARFAPLALVFTGPSFLVILALWTRAIGRRFDRWPPDVFRAVS